MTMTSEQLRLRWNAYDAFSRTLATYDKMLAIHAVSLTYTGHNGTHHGSVAGGDEVSRTCHRALVDHWRRKLDLELANLLTHGVDASSEMPSENTEEAV